MKDWLKDKAARYNKENEKRAKDSQPKREFGDTPPSMSNNAAPDKSAGYQQMAEGVKALGEKKEIPVERPEYQRTEGTAIPRREQAVPTQPRGNTQGLRGSAPQMSPQVRGNALNRAVGR